MSIFKNHVIVSNCRTMMTTSHSIEVNRDFLLLSGFIQRMTTSTVADVKFTLLYLLTTYQYARRIKSLHFYPRDAMLARVFAGATWPSVRLSHAGIVSKRRKLAS